MRWARARDSRAKRQEPRRCGGRGGVSQAYGSRARQLPYYSETNQERRTRRCARTWADRSERISAHSTLDFCSGTTDAAPVKAKQSWMDRSSRAMEAGRDRWQPLLRWASTICARACAIEAPVLIMMGEHFHYTEHLDDFRRLRRGAGRSVPGRDLRDVEPCGAYAARTLRFMGVS